MTKTARTRRSGLAAIITKEFKRFFTDRRMVFTTVLLPGLMIYLIYFFIGNAMTSFLTVDDDYVPVVYAVDTPASLEAVFTQVGVDYTPATAAQIGDIKEQIEGKEADLLMVFPADFDAALAARPGGADGASGADGAGGAYQQPNVALYFNSTRTESSSEVSLVSGLLDAYKSALTPSFTINAGTESYDLVTEQDATGFMFASLLPMLMLIFLYSGCIGVAPESIAGEKERGTIATLLVTPLKRWELALGKIVSLGAIALLAGASSFLGVMLSLPRLLGGTSGGGTDGVAEFTAQAVGLYGPADYGMLLAVILATVLMFVGLISVLSAFARTIKEANTYVMPLMVIIMLMGASAMFASSAAANPVLYLIPAYNSAQCMVAIFSFTAVPLNIALTVAANVVVTALCVLALTRMFSSEKIVFQR